jgi:hypothetical protein
MSDKIFLASVLSRTKKQTKAERPRRTIFDSFF